MILLIDNYDSFVHNLARYLRELGCETYVVRNDAMSAAEVAAMRPGAVILSPGPRSPAEAGICLDLVQKFGDRLPMLGVCLGHQVLAAAFGGEVVRAAEPIHGHTSPIHHNGTGLFRALPATFHATRYHSLVVRESSLPPVLQVTARTPDGIVMALEHVQYPLYGVQFHPESILTEHGRLLLRNFLELAHLPSKDCAEHDRPPTPDDQDSEAANRLGGQFLHW